MHEETTYLLPRHRDNEEIQVKVDWEKQIVTALYVDVETQKVEWGKTFSLPKEGTQDA